MAENSIATTGGISAASATLVTLLQWVFPTIPVTVLPAVAAVLVAGLHSLHSLAVIKGWYPQDASEPSKNAPAPEAAASGAQPTTQS